MHFLTSAGRAATFLIFLSFSNFIQQSPLIFSGVMATSPAGGGGAGGAAACVLRPAGAGRDGSVLCAVCGGVASACCGAAGDRSAEPLPPAQPASIKAVAARHVRDNR